MTRLNARDLHNETSAVLDEVAKGKSFEILRNGKVLGTIKPSKPTDPSDWSEIMGEVWAAHKKVIHKTSNPVLGERARRRR
jgi:antitoxin (DNA-binding transcriptional repressor) of toxin-antitoxin stability system